MTRPAAKISAARRSRCRTPGGTTAEAVARVAGAEIGGSLAPSKKDETSLIANNPSAALALADDLARLMDDLATRQVPFTALETLVPRDVDIYWQLTLRFLQIARETWPAILREKGKIEPAARRDLLIKAEADRLRHMQGPVIAAGSTGSIPATAELLATIANLPLGATVLPGLDTDLDAGTHGTRSAA